MNKIIEKYNLIDYAVSDMLNSDTKIIFVLESPHTQEVKNGYPVAGKSGKDMSKVLLKDVEFKQHSFGKLIYENKLPTFGIINVSNIPLQQSAYDQDSCNIPQTLFREFELFRQNPSPRKKKCDLNTTIVILAKDFKKRLKPHKDKKIVLCGRFAQKIFNDLFSHSEFKDIIEIPHPSFNNWAKVKYSHKIEELLEFID